MCDLSIPAPTSSLESVALHTDLPPMLSWVEISGGITGGLTMVALVIFAL